MPAGARRTQFCDSRLRQLQTATIDLCTASATPCTPWPICASGDPDDAEQVVIDAFRGLYGDAGTTCTPHQRWRLLADHVQRANEVSGVRSAPGPAAFRDAGLSGCNE